MKPQQTRKDFPKAWFISDLHLGEKNVLTFDDNARARAMNVSTIAEHDQQLIANLMAAVRPQDTLYVLGDLGPNWRMLEAVPGTKKLLMGNHDKEPARLYLEVFDDIIGTIKFRAFWLSHIPIHESELYGRGCIHGHIHASVIPNFRYVNVCPELTGGHPIAYWDINAGNYNHTSQHSVNSAATLLNQSNEA